MRFAIRICRHCKTPASFDDTKCRRCKKKLMNPAVFKAVFFAMIAMIVLVYGALLFIWLSVQQAYAATCQKSFYARANVPEDFTCTDACNIACGERGSGSGTGLLLTTGYKTDSANLLLGCECTCSKCIS